MTRAVLLLDVDGVLSPFGKIPAARRAELTQASLTGYWSSFLYDRAVLDRLLALHTTGALELQWLTSWQEEARDTLAPKIGIPELHVHRDTYGGNAWWKGIVARQLVATGRPVIWCDDDIDDARHELADFLNAEHLLAICPPIAVGLTLADVERIEAFARAAHAGEKTTVDRANAAAFMKDGAP